MLLLLMMMMMTVMAVLIAYRNRPTKLNENEHIYGNNGNERVPCHELPDLDLRPWYSPYVGASPPAKTWTFTKQAGRKSL